MLQVFDQKVIISGNEIEQYIYKDKAVLRGYVRRKRKNNGKEKEKEDKKEQKDKTAFSANRTRTEIRRKVNANPQLNKFLTLTSTSVHIDEMNKNFNAFTKRMRFPYPDFQYLAVMEFQDDIDFFGKIKPEGGEVHYHLLCNLPWVDQKKIAKIWGQGYIKIKRADRITNYGRYICKYIRKDMSDKRMFGKKKYFCSQDLEKPVEIIGDDAKFFMKDSDVNLKLIREATWKEEHRGEVLYKLFNFKNTGA